MKFVVYYAQMARFNIFNNTFLAKFCCILFKYCKSCNIICDIIQSLILYEVRSFLDKNSRFISYIINSAQELIQAKMKSVFSSNQFKLLIEDMDSRRFGIFLLVTINRVYKQEVLFLCFLLIACIDSHMHNINNPNLNLANDILLLCNNIVNLSELKK